MLAQAVRRNLERFPEDFKFQLSAEEFQDLRSQTVISSWGGRRYRPYGFTEFGVAMLSSVLGSKAAIQVNVAIMRTFVRLRQILATHEDAAKKLKEHDRQIAKVFTAVEKLLTVPEPKKNPIGYIQQKD